MKMKKNFLPNEMVPVCPLFLWKSSIFRTPASRIFYYQGLKAVRLEKMIRKQSPIIVGDVTYRILELKNSTRFKTYLGERLLVRYYTKREDEGIVMHPFEDLEVFEKRLGRTL